MRRCLFLLISALCVLTRSSVLVAQSPQLTPFRGLIDHVTAEPSGSVNATGDIWKDAISGDGRFVVFQSDSSTIAPGDYEDNNSWEDIFVRDRTTGVTTRVSKTADGNSPDDVSGYGTISANGRYVAFASGSSNLVAGDTNYRWDVFVRDLDQQTTVRVSVATDGTEGDEDSYYPSISADGRFVAFLSWASTLGPPEVDWSSDRQLYLHDRDTDGNGVFDEPGTAITELISIGLDGAAANRGVDTPHVSSDGRYVLYESESTNLDAYVNGTNHLYRRDRQTGQTELIDRAMTGGPSSWGVYYGTSDMSDDGRYITFSSISDDIVWFDMNWQSQVFLYDTVAGPAATQIVSKLPDDTLANASSYATSVSGDGRYVVFTTEASNLASPAPASGLMLVARDMLDGSFARVDVIDNGDAFDQADDYITPSISADGTAIVLSSSANNPLINGYGGDQRHVFVLTALAASPAAAAFPMSGGTGAIAVETSAVNGWNASTSDSWIVIEGYGAPSSVHFAGPGTVHYEVSDNPSGIARDGRIRIGAKTIAIRQEGDGDPTPPVITPIITGTQVNGWYTSDITLSFEVSDPDSEIVSLSYNCTQTLTLTSDFLYAAPQCEATSHGGTASVTVPLRRDTTPPTVWFAQPRPTIYPYGEIVNVSYACYESLSPITSCVGPTMWSPIDTWTRGPHSVTVTATDEAGNTATRTIDYFVPTDQCISSPVAPANLKRWFMFDGNLSDSISGLTASGSLSNGTFETGMVRQGWSNDRQYNYLSGLDSASTVAGPSGLTVAMWVQPLGVFYPFTLPDYQTLVFNPTQYHVVTWNDGTLRWAFNTTTGFNWVNTGVDLGWADWYHVALTYQDGIVRTFVNGNLVHTQALSGSLMTGPNTGALQIGGQSGSAQNNAFRGVIDDLMIFDVVVPASDLENLARSGSGSFCVPFESNLTVTAPQTIAFGNAFAATATLTDGTGRPIPHRPVTLRSAVSPAEYVENVLTDEAGSVLVQFPISAEVPIGEYPNAITVDFAGDNLFAPAHAETGVTLLPGSPSVYWEPEPLTYGTPLGAPQLNAVSMPGTYVYDPPAGTILGAGPHTLSVIFTPDDPHWAQHTLSRTIVVDKATPTIEISSTRPIYNGQPQAASATVRGIGGAVLTPHTVLYNGSTTPPINAGTYSIEVQFAGDDNYAATTATGSFTIDKAAPYLEWLPTITSSYGTPLSAAALNATSNVAGTFEYSPAAGVVLNVGTHLLTATFTPSDTINYETGSTTNLLYVNKAYPHLSWAHPAAIGYGTPLGAAQLSATANTSGTFVYSPAAGTVLAAGERTLSVTFTPDDAANYTSAAASVSIAIAPAALTLQADNATKVYGEALPAFTASGAGFVNGDSIASLSGTLSFSTTATPTSAAGSYAVTPGGVSSANYTIAFAAGTLAVSKAATSMALTTTPSPSRNNQSIQLRAVVSAIAPGAGIATGTVEFRENGTLLGTATLVDGVATMNKSFKKGTHALTATYAGNANFTGSSGGATHQTQ
jgi:hypothetical protein